MLSTYCIPALYQARKEGETQGDTECGYARHYVTHFTRSLDLHRPLKIKITIPASQMRTLRLQMTG